MSLDKRNQDSTPIRQFLDMLYIVFIWNVPIFNFKSDVIINEGLTESYLGYILAIELRFNKTRPIANAYRAIIR